MIVEEFVIGRVVETVLPGYVYESAWVTSPVIVAAGIGQMAIASTFIIG